jgi:putative chitinase
MKLNRKHFFDTVRASLFKGKMSKEQVAGMESILLTWETEGLADLRWLAYMLATIFHETAKKVNGVFTRTMQPVEESGKGAGYRYGKKIKRSGIAYSLPDKLYYGRGYVQLTWYENYENMGRLLGVDLLNNPDLALQTVIASKIMFEGMTKGDSSFGDFTGKSLENYFNDKKEDWVNARRIINGTDKADLIAGYGKKFMGALKIV